VARIRYYRHRDNRTYRLSNIRRQGQVGMGHFQKRNLKGTPGMEFTEIPGNTQEYLGIIKKLQEKIIVYTRVYNNLFHFNIQVF